MDKGGNYLLPVKGNQKKLQLELVDSIFSSNRLEGNKTETYSTSEKRYSCLSLHGC